MAPVEHKSRGLRVTSSYDVVYRCARRPRRPVSNVIKNENKSTAIYRVAE